ncbi:GerAB/ArcD/ProY family transporter [Brevibacillus nitrificans]|uniref:GerAB/ArcD/ProY family transporter n=1 Tax=Brevibacillus nitrificans TaxID=651560 RepID=UPI00260CC767|nr:endospore germination permease [Brevibacillus nitrificans]MED1792097.1 endospore germination permease [Brevibacillus nitrificans]
MERSEKISGTQLSLLLFSFIAPTLILVIPGLMAKYSMQDAWITIFPMFITGALSIWLIVLLSNRYPGMTIIEYSSQIIGKIPGKILGCYLLFYWVNFDFIILNQHIQFINTVLLHRSPAIVISLTLAILCGIAAYMGIESIARTNEFLSFFIFFVLCPLIILMLMESDPERLRPILSKGIIPVLQASIFPSAYTSQVFILGWLLPFLNHPKKAMKASTFALFAITGLFIVTVFPLFMIFGPLTDRLTFPVLSVLQYIGLKGSFERLEAIGVVIWVMGCFVKISLTFFIMCLSITQIFDIKNYRELIIPITVLSVIGSVTVFKNYSTDLNHYLEYTYPFYASFTHLLIPLALLMIDTLKKSWKKSVL